MSTRFTGGNTANSGNLGNPSSSAAPPGSQSGSSAAVAATPAQLADDAIRAALNAQYQGERLMIVESPPGGGKTGIVERLAAQEMARLAGRAMIATQTNQQAFDLARRCASGFPRLPFTLFLRDGLSAPPDLRQLANLRIVSDPQALPPGPCVVVANAAKWSWLDVNLAPDRFSLLVVDEAYQLHDYQLHLIAGLAKRIALVGDPGQIAPVVTCETERWRSDPAGPHVACPKALRARFPGIMTVRLPVSRRLPQDTVDVVQPAFYPQLPFVALNPPGSRQLSLTVAGLTPLDLALDLAASGASLVSVELKPRVTGVEDDELANRVVELIERLFARGAQTVERGQAQPLTPGMIGVVCAHVTQVNAILERLPRSRSGMSDILVETADRFQGLEREIMIAYHPLSGRVDADAFHLDAGRLCVMLSRHRVTCFVVARGGLRDLLERYSPDGDRALGIEEDSEFGGWRAHLSLLQALEGRSRVVRHP